MNEIINEAISVDLISSHSKKQAYPWVVSWRGRRYEVKHVGLHYTNREGRTLFHYFTVATDTIAMKLRLDTDTLGWKIVEIAS